MEIEAYLWFGILSFTLYLIRQFFKRIELDTGSKKLSRKLIVVTGSNSGIGYEVALELARRGASVILACRSAERGLKAQQEIRKETGNNSVRYKRLDLASFQSIREFARQLRNEEKSLYSLVNNAGLFWIPYQKTMDGHEGNFGVNHLGHFLLTILLLPLLCKEKHSRVVAVCSLMYMFGKLDFDDLNQANRNYDFVKAYSDSKLANLLTARVLSQKMVSCSNVRTYCADPGVVATKIGKGSILMGSSLYKYILQPLTMALFMRTPVEGAQPVIYCVCSEEIENESGQLYSAKGRDKIWPAGLDDAAANRLWDESIRLTYLEASDLAIFK